MLPVAAAQEVVAVALPHLLRLRAMGMDAHSTAGSAAGRGACEHSKQHGQTGLLLHHQAHRKLPLRCHPCGSLARRSALAVGRGRADRATSPSSTSHKRQRKRRASNSPGAQESPLHAQSAHTKPAREAHLQNSVQLMPEGPRSECLNRPLSPAALRRGQKQAGRCVVAPRSSPLQYLRQLPGAARTHELCLAMQDADFCVAPRSLLLQCD